MKCNWRRPWLALLLLCASAHSLGDVVIADDGATMSRAELEYIVSRWTAQMQQDAANDLGDRIELLNTAMAGKKIAGESDLLTPEQDGDVYWQKEMLVRKALQSFMVERFIETINPPDMTELARERYLADKDKYGWVPPARLTSHILIRCSVGESCEGAELRQEADNLLVQLRAGADFEAMVLKHSQDPGTRLRKGRFEKWLEPQTTGVDKAFLKGAFAIENVGEYSEVVTSAYGLHIIRLDETKEGYHRTFEQAKPKILSELVQEHARLSIKLFDEGYRFTDELYIDGDAMEEIFNPYKTVE